MPELANKQHEVFCQMKALGQKNYEAVLAAGYQINPGNPQRRNKVASDRGTMLLRKPKVIARVAEIEEELRTNALKRAEVDRTYVINNLKDNSERAQQAVPVTDRQGNETGEYKQDTSASNRALELIGKEVGMFKDRFDTEGLDEKIQNMTNIEVRAQIRAAATAVGLRMVEMDDAQLRTFILTHAPRVGLRCVEASAGDLGSGEAPEDGSVPALSEAGELSQSRN